MFDLRGGICRDCYEKIYEGDKKTIDIYLKIDTTNIAYPPMRDPKLLYKQYTKTRLGAKRTKETFY